MDNTYKAMMGTTVVAYINGKDTNAAFYNMQLLHPLVAFDRLVKISKNNC